MGPATGDFYRIKKLPPYVFAVINELKAKARAAQRDVIDLGMGNPDGATPKAVVAKLAEAARNPRNHRYSMSRGIPNLRQEIAVLIDQWIQESSEAMLARWMLDHHKSLQSSPISSSEVVRTFLDQSATLFPESEPPLSEITPAPP